MGDNGERLSNRALLVGPEIVTIHVASARGPLAGRNAKLATPATQVSLVNAGATTLEVARLAIDPLRRSDTGARAESDLSAEPAPAALAAGESVAVTISGSVPAKPGIYLTTLRAEHKDDPSLAVRVEYRVAARWTWGFACMLVGLFIVALINLLDGESGVKGALRRALLDRQRAHEFFQQVQPAQSRAAQIDEIDREFDAAIAHLRRRRELSFVDRRGADADEHLRMATDLTLDLRKSLSSHAPRSEELSELTEQWKNLKSSFTYLSSAYFSPVPRGVSLNQRLSAFDTWAAERLLRPPIAYYTGEIDDQINNLQLLYASGREQDAATKAVAVRGWLQLAAESVKTAARSVKGFVQLHANDIVSVQRMHQWLDSAEIAVERRTTILKSLDDLAASLSEPLHWESRRAVSLHIQETRTALLRAASEAVKAATEVSRAREEREDSIESVQAVIDEGATLRRGPDGKIDPVEKTLWMRRVAAAWRARLATLPDANPPAMLSQIDSIEAAIQSNRLDAVSEHTHQLFALWAAYSSDRARSAILKQVAPFCLKMRDDILVDMEAAQQTMRALDGDPNLQRWQGELSALNKSTHATPDVVDKMPQDCLDIMNKLSSTAYGVSNEIASALWNTWVLPDATKQELAADLASSLTPEALATMTHFVRPVRIEVATPVDERNAERKIEFKFLNLGPDWGEGDKVTVHFGDGTLVRMSGEDLRKRRSVTHVYSNSKTYAVTIIVADSFQQDVAQPVGKIFGRGDLRQLRISPSPISLARQLEDTFFNARFALSLLIAGLLYFWRYHSSKAVFGANPFDYAQAFALGFAVSLALNELPQKLAEFVSMKG